MDKSNIRDYMKSVLYILIIRLKNDKDINNL